MSPTINITQEQADLLAAGESITIQADYRVVRDAVAVQTDRQGKHAYAVLEGRLYANGWLGFVRSRHLLDYDGQPVDARVRQDSPADRLSRPTIGLWVDGPQKWFTLVER